MSIDAQQVIITCAVTGSIHTPSMSPYLPVTPREIARQSIDAAEAGAAILHLHARTPEDGRPSADPNVYMQFLPQIRRNCTAIVNITTGGSARMSLDERLAAANATRPEMCSLNMGSMNFGLYPEAEQPRDWRYDWEVPFLESTRHGIFRNTFADIERIVGDMQAHDTRFEFECFDVGHIYTLAHFLERGVVQPPLFIQFVLGDLGGIGPDPENLVHMKRIADKLFGDQYMFSVVGAGRDQMALATQAALMGGHVRVGLEDSLYLETGHLAASNAEQVLHIREILERLSLTIATAEQARRTLGLKGSERVGF